MPKKKTKKKEATKHWLLSIESVAGTDDISITFPDDLMDSIKWKAGDTILWTPEGDGWILTKINKQS
jgi:hypothetical protein